MRFCQQHQLDRTRRVLVDRQGRIEKRRRERELRRIARITVIPPTRQLEIAIQALATQNAQQGREEQAA